MLRHCVRFSLAILMMLVGVQGDQYDGYKLIKVFGKSVEDARFLNSLQQQYAKLDFWSGPSIHKTNVILIPPTLTTTIQAALSDHGIQWTQSKSDVLSIAKEGMVKHKPTRPVLAEDVNPKIIDHENYHQYDQIVNYLNQLQSKYPENVEIFYLPYPTHERRRVAAAKVHGSASTLTKPSILIESGIHAREWISPAATLYVIEDMLERYTSGDNDTTTMMDEFDWYIIPVTNPDGYEFTHLSPNTRFWRKNMRRMQWGCVGVDLNRNFDVEFGTVGVSSNCASYVYPGEKPFSEPETANIRELFQQIRGSVIGYLSVHSYSQFILVPWSFSTDGEQPPNANELNRVGQVMADAIHSQSGYIYKVGTAWNLLEYAASGGSDDWASHTKPGLYSYTFELRPDADDYRGFNLGPGHIIPTGQELYASFLAFSQNVIV